MNFLMFSVEIFYFLLNRSTLPLYIKILLEQKTGGGLKVVHAAAMRPITHNCAWIFTKIFVRYEF